jgi:hypothetical protein
MKTVTVAQAVLGGEKEAREIMARRKGVQTKVWDFKPVNIFDFFRHFLSRPVLSERQKDVARAICGDKADEFSQEYQEIVCMVGMKGGKNWLFEGVFAYFAYKLMCLSNPHAYFGVAPDKEISLTNSSLVNARQAEIVFFNNLKKVMRNTIDPDSGDNWFERHVGVRIDERYGDLKKKTIDLPKSVRFHSFDSQPESPEGLLILVGCIDEPSRANTPIRYEEAKKLHKVVSRNALASFKKYSKTVLFSYPEQQTCDLIVDRYEESQKKGNKHIFGVKIPTWVFNPTVTRESLQTAFDEDPMDANCRYGCIIPPPRFGFYQPYPEKIRDCANPTLKNKIFYRPTITSRRTGKGMQVDVREFTGVEILGIQGDDLPRAFAGDAAVTRDAFIIGGGYPGRFELERERLELPLDMEMGVLARPIIDVMIVWKPERDRPVDYLNVSEVIGKLLEAFPATRSFTFDKFNSEKIRQEILARGVECEPPLHFSNPEQVRLHKILRHLVWNNTAEYLDIEEMLVELEQLLFINKTKIDHPPGGSKDYADVLAILASKLIQMQYGTTVHFDFGVEPSSTFAQAVDRYRREAQALKVKLRREPSDAEVARALNETEETIAGYRAFLQEEIMLGDEKVMSEIEDIFGPFGRILRDESEIE